MHVITGNNVNELFVEGLWRLKVSGQKEESRNGNVIVLDAPAMSVYRFPMERVLFDPDRDCNPFFHLMESLWMLAGRNDVAFLEHYNKRMKEFSDDGTAFNGAYGHRWREHFMNDQLVEAIGMLKHSKTTRRVVMGMWDPGYDLGTPSKDIPCNTHIYFRTLGDRLDMTVCCRSNDAVWGAYGANAVHFSILHEFVARAAGLRQGLMYQLSNNFHIYEHHWHMLDVPTRTFEPYCYKEGLVIPLFENQEEWVLFLEDCETMDFNSHPVFHTDFFNKIVRNCVSAWNWYKNGNINAALSTTALMPMCDWRIAMESWLIRRIPKGAHDVPEPK